MALRTISGRHSRKVAATKAAAVAILQAADIERADIEALRVERARQSLDRREIGGEQIGAIEHDDGERASRHVRHAEFMNAMHGDRLGGRPWSGASPARCGHEIERAARIFRTAFGEIAIEPGEHRVPHGGKLREPRILAAIARQKRERHAGGAGGVGQLLGAVAPIIEPAEQADDHAAGAGDHLLDIEVDRHRVAEPGEIGEAQGGQLASLCADHAAAAAPRSLSEKDRKTRSARDWPRSMAASASSNALVSRTSKCMA